MFKSLIQSSYNLTGLSLEAFIGDITAQGQNYAFYELLSHPQIHTVSPEVKSIVELFANLVFQDYSTNRQQYAMLNTRQIYTLKKLTLLDLFGGKNILSLVELENKLQLTREELIDFLMKLNIEGTIQIKIDEYNETIKIANAEKRKKKMTQNSESALNAKINSIKTDLNELQQKIVNIKETLQKDKKSDRKKESRIDIEGNDI